MSRKLDTREYYVKITPDDPWILGDQTPEQQHKRWSDKCRSVVADVKRHLDVADVDWDYNDTFVCEHCGYAWGGDSETYNGGCCEKDEEGRETGGRP